MAALTLTAEQLKRIERNRAEAMRRMALRQQREKEMENTGNVAVNNDFCINSYSSDATGKAQVMMRHQQAELRSLDSSSKVQIRVRDENRPKQIPVAKGSDECKSNQLSSSPTKYVIRYRNEQEPSTSKVEVNRKIVPVSLSPIKRPPVITTINLKQSIVNVIFKLTDSKSFQVSFFYH